MHLDTGRVCMTPTPGMEGDLNLILDAINSDYVKFRHNVINRTEMSCYAKQMRSVSSQLSVDDKLVYIDAKQIALPIKAVKDILRLARIPHTRITKTNEFYRSLYFWPGMFNDVKQMISA